MSSNISFIRKLIRNTPELNNLYTQHLAENDGLLPHVFLGSVTRTVVSCAFDQSANLMTIRVFQHLEEGLQSGDEKVAELIGCSFVENLFGEERALSVLIPMMGHRLRLEVERWC